MDARRLFAWMMLVAACFAVSCESERDAAGVGPGLPAGAALNPSAGAYFNDGRDGEFRARVENIFDRDVGVDWRGLGGQTPGQLVNLDDVRAIGPDINLAPSNYTPPREQDVSVLNRIGYVEDYDVEIAQTARIVRRSVRRSVGGTRPKAWQPSGLAPHSCRIAVGDKETLPLTSTDVSVRIEGFRARIEIDFVFRNDRDRQLEGSFDLRLPEGASPHALAFGALKAEKPAVVAPVAATIAAAREQRASSWEKPKEARMVPREKAAYAYGDTVRQKVDPALLEWSGAGVFSTRVFPLEPGRSHRIAIAYDIDLVPAGGDLLYRLDLPEVTGDLDVRLEVGDGQADVSPAAMLEGGVRHWERPKARTFVARIHDHASSVLEGEDSAVGPLFAAQFRPDLPQAAAKVCERALFLVDVSASANSEAFPVWLSLLEQILARNRPALRDFAVAFWNVETSWWRAGFQPNTPENVADALAFARRLSLESATDLGQALSAARMIGGAYDLFLLSDGSTTWGEDDPAALSRLVDPGHAVFSYRTGAGGTDAATLNRLARETGGAVFSILGESGIASAATAHASRPWRIEDVRWAGAEDLMIAGRPTALYPGQIVRVVGRGRPEATAPLRVTLARERETRVVESMAARRIPSSLAARAYGEVAVGQLEDVDANGAPARAYATHFRVVGRACSLLMLESEADYERYGIRPEDVARAVRSTPAAAAVAAVVADQGVILGDPKRRFLDWLERLAAAPEVGLKLPEAVSAALRALPPEAFEVRPAPLACRSRASADVPADVRRALGERTLAYDAASAEAERRRAAFGPGDALKALATLVEDQPGDLALAKDIAFTAMEWGLDAQAYGILRRVVTRRTFERPTWHEIALSLERAGKIDLAVAFYEVGLAMPDAAQRFGDAARVLAFDYLRLLRRIESGEVDAACRDFARSRREAVAAAVGVAEADLVIVMSWNTDRTDVDLHVTDPNAEEAFYSHPDTKIGGHLTRDVTTGFGPEMFVLPKAIPGVYAAKARYYRDDGLRASTRSKVYVTTYEDWGRAAERVGRKTVVLRGNKEDQPIATIRR